MYNELLDRQREAPEEKLDAFENYDDYLNYVGTMFELSPEAYAALFSVLVKLQHVGHDPVRTLNKCKFDMAPGDCADLLDFMMDIEQMDLAELQSVAAAQP